MTEAKVDLGGWPEGNESKKRALLGRFRNKLIKLTQTDVGVWEVEELRFYDTWPVLVRNRLLDICEEVLGPISEEATATVTQGSFRISRHTTRTEGVFMDEMRWVVKDGTPGKKVWWRVIKPGSKLLSEAPRWG